MSVSVAKFENKVYEPMRAYIKEHHGWSSDELTKTQLWADYQAAMDELRAFDGMKVRIKYSTSEEWHAGSGEKIGRIRVKDNGQVMFFEGRNRTRFQWLDLGMYDGWRATIIAREIEAV